jgi:hypothetical protein
VKIRGWPHPFLIATKDLYEGDELLYKYSEAYCKLRDLKEEGAAFLRCKS